LVTPAGGVSAAAGCLLSGSRRQMVDLPAPHQQAPAAAISQDRRQPYLAKVRRGYPDHRRRRQAITI
jgi:hypothetical protein